MDYSERLIFAKYLDRGFQIQDIFTFRLTKTNNIEKILLRLNVLIEDAKGIYSQYSTFAFRVLEYLHIIMKNVLDHHLIQFDQSIMNFGLMIHPDLKTRLIKLRSRHTYAPAQNIRFNFNHYKKVKVTPFNINNRITRMTYSSKDIYVEEIVSFYTSLNLKLENIAEDNEYIFNSDEEPFDNYTKVIDKILDVRSEYDIQRILALEFYCDNIIGKDNFDMLVMLKRFISPHQNEEYSEFELKLWNYTWKRVIKLNLNSMMDEFSAWTNIPKPDFFISDDMLPWSIRDGTEWDVDIENMLVNLIVDDVTLELDVESYIARQNPRFINHYIDHTRTKDIKSFNFAFPKLRDDEKWTRLEFGYYYSFKTSIVMDKTPTCPITDILMKGLDFNDSYIHSSPRMIGFSFPPPKQISLNVITPQEDKIVGLYIVYLNHPRKLHRRTTIDSPNRHGIEMNVEVFLDDFQSEVCEFLLLNYNRKVMVSCLHKTPNSDVIEEKLKKSRIDDVFWIFQHYLVYGQDPPTIKL